MAWMILQNQEAFFIQLIIIFKFFTYVQKVQKSLLFGSSFGSQIWIARWKVHQRVWKTVFSWVMCQLLKLMIYIENMYLLVTDGVWGTSD